MKSDKLFNATNSLIIGTSLFMIGILLIVGREWLYINVVNIFLIAILLMYKRIAWFLYQVYVNIPIYF